MVRLRGKGKWGGMGMGGQMVCRCIVGVLDVATVEAIHESGGKRESRNRLSSPFPSSFRIRILC